MPFNLPLNSSVIGSSSLGLNASCKGVLTLTGPALELTLAALWCMWNKLTVFLDEDSHPLPAGLSKYQLQILPWAACLDSLLCQMWPLTRSWRSECGLICFEPRGNIFISLLE